MKALGGGGLSGQVLVSACGKESMVPMEWETGWALKSVWHFGQATKIFCSCSESSHNISVIESAHSSLPLSLLTVYLNHLHCCVVLKLNTFHDHWHWPFTIYVCTMVPSDITFSKGIAFLLFQSVVAFVLVFYMPCGLYWVSHITVLLPYERYCVSSAMCVMALYRLNHNKDISCPVAPGVLL
jgi:hypothetical protein